MKDEKPNYYAIIPAEIRYDDNLTPNEKILYGEITALTNQNGECWATNSYFSNLYKVEIPSVSRWLRHLKEKKYIDIQILYKEKTKEIEKRIIKINGTPINKNVKTYSQERLEGINKNVKENNTRINNKRKYIKEKNLISDFIGENNFNKDLENVLNDWIIYKNERNENYTEIGFKKLLTEIKNNINNYSEKQVISIINKSMARNWKGIQFQILQDKPSEKEVKYL